MSDASSSETSSQDPIWGIDEIRKRMESNSAFLRDLQRKRGLSPAEINEAGDE